MYSFKYFGGLFQLYLIDSVKKRQESGGRERSGEDIRVGLEPRPPVSAIWHVGANALG